MTAENPNRNKKAVFGWTMYDWANSVYSLVITTAIFPLYFNGVSSSTMVMTKCETDAIGVDNAFVPLMGFELKSISLLSMAVSIAYLIIAIASPILGAIADYSGSKKKFMMFFCFMGAASCSAMFFFDSSTYYLGFWLFVIAAIGYAGSAIFNDAFLPEISEAKDYDKVSARGFAMGYIGSVILLVFNLVMMKMPSLFFDVAGRTKEVLLQFPTLSEANATQLAEESFLGVASKISFLTVGIWWFGFSMITFFSLKDVKPSVRPQKNYLTGGFAELKKVMKELKQLKWLKRFLLAFFFYNMGIQTVMYMASSFGQVELRMGSGDLIISILLIQIVAIVGSFLFAFLSRKIGNFMALFVGIIIWILVCVIAYFVTERIGFFVVGGIVGMVMGGMQALSRSTYSKLIPDATESASFFSFYQITDKVSVIVGTFCFGLISQTMGTRNSIIALTAFFIVGGIMILAMSRQNLLKNETPS